ncbi:uncharacterized protein LOC112565232 [Pomacea canaliculata]|uniref:uncharacterized protein LOC112565232 n=1 Tax=Pomacea canaliculata TaxID=400727 RepID=UPI000D72A963|nr:uncharacterized protein LOC112565232 [Pomacea canaliculata]XP_025096368.1 uncharacterized protein LOC112565232 [Pomacea canaliculata]
MCCQGYRRYRQHRPFYGGNDDVRDWSRDPDGADILADSIASVKSGLEEAAKRAGITLVTSSFSVASIAFCFSVALIIFGIFLAVVSVLGFIGVSCGFKSALVVHLILTLILFLAQLVLVLIAVINPSVFDDAVKPHLKQTITENYSGMNSSDSTTQIWNGVMIKLSAVVSTTTTTSTRLPSGRGSWVTPATSPLLWPAAKLSTLIIPVLLHQHQPPVTT